MEKKSMEEKEIERLERAIDEKLRIYNRVMNIWWCCYGFYTLVSITLIMIIILE
jgi:hypothetical protein